MNNQRQLLTLFSRPSMYLYTMLRRYYKHQSNSYQHKQDALYKKTKAIYVFNMSNFKTTEFLPFSADPSSLLAAKVTVMTVL